MLNIAKKRPSPEKRRQQQQQRLEEFKKQFKSDERLHNLPVGLKIKIINKQPPVAEQPPPPPVVEPSHFLPPGNNWHILPSPSRPHCVVHCFETVIFNERPTVVKSAEINFDSGRMDLSIGDRKLNQRSFNSVQHLEELLSQFHSSVVCSGIKSSK